LLFWKEAQPLRRALKDGGTRLGILCERGNRSSAGWRKESGGGTGELMLEYAMMASGLFSPAAMRMISITLKREEEE